MKLQHKMKGRIIVLLFFFLLLLLHSILFSDLPHIYLDFTEGTASLSIDLSHCSRCSVWADDGDVGFLASYRAVHWPYNHS